MQWPDDVRMPECRAFAQAWQGWRGSELVPLRSAVRIEEISGLLPMISVVEVISPTMAKFRLAGSALSAARGIEMTGLNYYDLTTPEDRRRRIARTHQVVTLPCGAHVFYAIPYRSGRTVPAEVLSLPVRPDDPTAPPQIFAISMPIETIRHEEAEEAPKPLPKGDGFRFIDIGAGLPDAGLHLD